jgi:Zn ribbon nucleic-acid-binding protein
MGPMDAQDGTPTQECPECGLSYNDKNKKIREKSRGMQ